MICKSIDFTISWELGGGFLFFVVDISNKIQKHRPAFSAGRDTSCPARGGGDTETQRHILSRQRRGRHRGATCIAGGGGGADLPVACLLYLTLEKIPTPIHIALPAQKPLKRGLKKSIFTKITTRATIVVFISLLEK